MREMKDSGIEWIGEIPKDWEVVRTKNISDISIGLVTTMTSNYVDDVEEGVPLIRNGNIRCNYIDSKGMVYLSRKFAEQNSHRLLRKGHIATVHTGDIGTSVVIDEEYDCSMGFATIQSIPHTDKVYTQYLCWYYNSEVFKMQCIAFCTGDGRQNLNLYDFVDFKVILPSIREQKLISDYIDKKCIEIDNLIADIQKQIDTLEQYKKSVITEAVTKGLNPDVEMKDSGIEWIGEIPKDWEVTRIKHICDKITDGSHFSPKIVENGKKYITATNVIYDKVDIESAKEISEENYQILVKNGCQPKKGDVLLTKDGSVGRSAVVIDTDCVILSSVGILTPGNKIKSNYLKYSLDSNYLQEQMYISMAGSALKRITLTKIYEYKIVVPPKTTQNHIVNYLEEKCREINSVILDKKKQLETLEQYKKSLIYEYVTGKKEVPNE